MNDLATEITDRALAWAISQIGVKEDPPGSNRGPAVDGYLRRVGLDPEQGNYPWCAAFVCWCIWQGCADLGRGWPPLVPSASVKNLLERNASHVLERPEPGCIFIHLQPDGHGHTGFVEAVHDDGGFDSVEGNSNAAGSRTGGSVVRLKRPAGYARAFLRIAI